MKKGQALVTPSQSLPLASSGSQAGTEVNNIWDCELLFLYIGYIERHPRNQALWQACNQSETEAEVLNAWPSLGVTIRCETN